jgi:hypothetical protein
MFVILFYEEFITFALGVVNTIEICTKINFSVNNGKCYKQLMTVNYHTNQLQPLCTYIRGINRYRECSKKHFGNQVPNSDFPVLQCLGIVSLVLGIILYCLREYHLKKSQ